MNPWFSLTGKAFLFKTKDRPGETIFFYNSPPVNEVPSLPAFVLIHGLGDEADSWRRLIPLLNSRGYRVFALDLPGFGRSITSGKINLKTHATAVQRFLETVVWPAGTISRTESPVFLAGSSMGAIVAEAVALKKPALIQGLILLDGSIPGGPSNPGPLALAKLLFSRKWYRAYREDPKGAWVSLYPYYADLDAMPQEDREFLKQRVMARVESPTQERAFFATQRSLIRSFLFASPWFARKIRVFKGKILLLWGEKDRIIPLSSANVFKSLRPDINLEVIPGAGHLPHQEKPEETARCITDFAASLTKL